MIKFTNKTFKETVAVSEGDVTMNGVIEYSAAGLRSANLSSIYAGGSCGSASIDSDGNVPALLGAAIQEGGSCGSASIDSDGNVQLYGFKIEDIEAASSAVAGWMTEIKTHING